MRSGFSIRKEEKLSVIKETVCVDIRRPVKYGLRYTRAGRSPGYEGSSGEKGREKPGVRRIHRCVVQGGAQGTEDPLV